MSQRLTHMKIQQDHFRNTHYQSMVALARHLHMDIAQFPAFLADPTMFGFEEAAGDTEQATEQGNEASGFAHQAAGQRSGAHSGSTEPLPSPQHSSPPPKE